jgi:ParB family chromosome partitioning protein
MRQQILDMVIARELNVQDTDRLIEEQLRAEKEPSSKRPTIRLVRDVRLFVNTIHHAVDTMKRSGIPVISETTESDEFLVYTVRIPKERARRN